ncbi:hypothetical protein HAX54_048593, partial [Datura stramonium]|nr:hypothetical protein [Datura stramonium]
MRRGRNEIRGARLLLTDGLMIWRKQLGFWSHCWSHRRNDATVVARGKEMEKKRGREEKRDLRRGCRVL